MFINAYRTQVPDYAPRAFLGDVIEAFANAASMTFPSIQIRLMCFVHVCKVSISM